MLELISKTYITYKEAEGSKFYYKDFGSEAHGRTSFRLWISSKLIVKDNERNLLKFPIMAEIQQGKHEKTLVIKPSSNSWIINVFVSCGFRGGSYIDILDDNNLCVKFTYKEFSSPLGSTGVSQGALIQVPVTMDKVKISWQRDGRTYGAPKKGISIIYKDGRLEDLDDIVEEDLAMLEELKE